jgi:pimeloyl-ACP methyl ester carboxylesterase
MAEYTAAYTDPGKVRAMLGYYRAAARPQVAAALTMAKPVAPPQPYADRMLVLWGAQDPVLPVWVGESVVKDLGASCSMITVPGAGHFVLEEAPEVCLAALQELFADAPAPKKRAPRTL